MNIRLRQFVKVSDGRIGCVIANDACGGVFRGHCDVWFGEFADGKPVVRQLCVMDDWESVEAPLGVTDMELHQEETERLAQLIFGKDALL